MLRPLPVLSADFPEIHEGLALLRVHSVNQFVLHQIKLRSTESLPSHVSFIPTGPTKYIKVVHICLKTSSTHNFLSQAGRTLSKSSPKPKKLWFIYVRLRFRTPLGPIEPYQCPVNQVLPGSLSKSHAHPALQQPHPKHCVKALPWTRMAAGAGPVQLTVKRTVRDIHDMIRDDIDI